MHIVKVYAGEPAHLSGQVFEGDLVLALNDVSLQGRLHSDIVSMFQVEKQRDGGCDGTRSNVVSPSRQEMPSCWCWTPASTSATAAQYVNPVQPYPIIPKHIQLYSL